MKAEVKEKASTKKKSDPVDDYLAASPRAVQPIRRRIRAIVREEAPEATEKICSFLGHPKTCPHGAPIPAGECCTRPAAENMQRLFAHARGKS